MTLTTANVFLSCVDHACWHAMNVHTHTVTDTHCDCSPEQTGSKNVHKTSCKGIVVEMVKSTWTRLEAGQPGESIIMHDLLMIIWYDDTLVPLFNNNDTNLTKLTYNKVEQSRRVHLICHITVITSPFSSAAFDFLEWLHVIRRYASFKIINYNWNSAHWCPKLKLV
jgi:hypothetical protein